MKNETAIRNANKLAKRIKLLTGIIMTPEGKHEYIRIRRAWIFGSTIKGKENPNDVDILVEYHRRGRLKYTNKHRNEKRIQNCKTDKNYLRKYGSTVGLDSYHIALKYLTRNMKMIRIHDFRFDHRYAKPRIMIYPHNRLPRQPVISA